LFCVGQEHLLKQNKTKKTDFGNPTGKKELAKEKKTTTG